MQDYIERAIKLITNYVPPKPGQIEYALKNNNPTRGLSQDGASQIKFKEYYQAGDSISFTYDSVSKVLLRVDVSSYLVTPKDPVTLQAVFERLPDGVNHVSSATLNAEKKKVQVKTSNLTYEKTAN